MNTASPGATSRSTLKPSMFSATLGGEHELLALGRLARAEYERPDAVRIAEAENAVADHHQGSPA